VKLTRQSIPEVKYTWSLFKHRDTFNFTVRVKRTFMTSLDFYFPQGYQLTVFICTHPAYQRVLCLASFPLLHSFPFPYQLKRCVMVSEKCNILFLVIYVYKREVTSHVGGTFSCIPKKTAKRDCLLRHVCPSVCDCPHGTTWLLLDRVSLKRNFVYYTYSRTQLCFT